MLYDFQVCSLLLLAVFNGFLYDRLGSLGVQHTGPELVAHIKNGTRVVRGRDWEWDDQDGGPGGKGSVDGEIRKDKWVRVRWDVGGRNLYRMGHLDKYDLKLATDFFTTKRPTNFGNNNRSPTVPPEIKFISPGTRVVRGRDWRSGDQDGGSGSEGTLTAVGGDGWVTVMWDTGEDWMYRMGSNGKYDVMPAPTTTTTPMPSTSSTTESHFSLHESYDSDNPNPASVSGHQLALRKIGTRVMRIGDDVSCWDEGIEPGTLGTVQSSGDWDCFCVSWDNGQKLWYCGNGYNDCVELAPNVATTSPTANGTDDDSGETSVSPLRPPMSDAEVAVLKKIGTRVIRTEAQSCWDTVPRGSLGTVISVDDRWDSVGVSWDSGVQFYYFSSYGRCLKLAFTDSTPTVSTTTDSITETAYSSDIQEEIHTSTMSDQESAALKVIGTRVIRVMDGDCWIRDIDPGTFGTVLALRDVEKWDCVRVSWDDGNKIWYCKGSYEACVKLAPTVETAATDNPMDMSTLSTSDLPSEICCGKVLARLVNGTRIIPDEDWERAWYNEMVKPGSIGTVIKLDWFFGHSILSVGIKWDSGKTYYYSLDTVNKYLKLAPSNATRTSTPISVTETTYSSGVINGSVDLRDVTPFSPLSGPELAALMVKGARVVRGKDWEFGNTDGGPGNVGTVLYGLDIYECVAVKWDNGNTHWYRMGNNGYYDLKLAPTNMTSESSAAIETDSYSDKDDISTTESPSTQSSSKLAPFLVRGAKVVRANRTSYDEDEVGTVIYACDGDCVGVKWYIGVHWYCQGTYEDKLKLAPANPTTTSKPHTYNETRCMDRIGRDVYTTKTPWTLQGIDLIALIKYGIRVVRQERADDQDWSFGTILYEREYDSWIFYYPDGKYSCYYLKPASTYAEPTFRSVTNILSTSTPPSVTETVRDPGAPLSGPELAKLMKVGTRVVRGKDWDFWDYFEQDGGEGGQGTVIRGLDSLNWLAVRWDTGRAFTYRMGFEGKYDLQLAPDSSTTTWEPTVTTQRVKSNKDYRRHKPRISNRA